MYIFRQLGHASFWSQLLLSLVAMVAIPVVANPPANDNDSDVIYQQQAPSRILAEIEPLVANQPLKFGWLAQLFTPQPFNAADFNPLQAGQIALKIAKFDGFPALALFTFEQYPELALPPLSAMRVVFAYPDRHAAPVARVTPPIRAGPAFA